MTISFQPHQHGMTVLPDAIDQATGERIEGTAQIVDTRHVAFAAQDEEDSSEVDDPQFEDQDHLSEEDRDPEFEVRLADTFEEINTTEYEVSPEIVQQIAQVDLGDTPEAITVQYLASQVFDGNINPEEAFQSAVQSGLDPDKLMFQYYQLKSHFE